MKDVIGPLGAQVALIRKLNFSAGEETTLKFRAPASRTSASWVESMTHHRFGDDVDSATCSRSHSNQS